MGGWEGGMLAMLIAPGFTPGTSGGDCVGSELQNGRLASRASSEQLTRLGH